MKQAGFDNFANGEVGRRRAATAGRSEAQAEGPQAPKQSLSRHQEHPPFSKPACPRGADQHRNTFREAARHGVQAVRWSRPVQREVTPTGGKLWRLKFRHDGRENRPALGAHPDTTLKLAPAPYATTPRPSGWTLETLVFPYIGSSPIAKLGPSDMLKVPQRIEAVGTQIWIAVSNYVLVAIVKKRLKIQASLYEMLQILSPTMFEKTPLDTLFAQIRTAQNDADLGKQLNLFH